LKPEIGAKRARAAQTDDVAIGRGLGDPVDRDHSAGARTIFDHHRLAEQFLDASLNDASHRIRAASRRKADDETDRPVRIGIRCPASQAYEQTSRERRSDDPVDAQHHASTHDSWYIACPTNYQRPQQWRAVLLLIGHVGDKEINQASSCPKSLGHLTVFNELGNKV
jgi:hypothetical protein